MGVREVSHSIRESTLPGDQSQDRGPKEIGGSLQKRWGVWFNSTIHGEPYHPSWGGLSRPPPASTAWLSSARALGCGFQLPNERNPHMSVSPRAPAGGCTLVPYLVWQKSSHYGLYRVGDTRATRKVETKGGYRLRGSQSPKTFRFWGGV